ncbi:MAG TPA: tetratricopeptide repeat protein [Acidobacteriota bacterium]|jgi:tetratricopeptide (TPR) repeat protein
MQNRTLPAVIVSLVAGLIIGFFGGVAYDSQKAVSAQTTADRSAPADATQPDNSKLPENHPSKEVMEKVTHLLEHAQKDPNDKDSRIELGNIFYNLGQFEQAINYYGQVLELDPRNVNVRTDMGTSYHFLGDHDRALKEFAISLNLDPTHAETLQNMGWVKYNGKKDYKGALEAWNKLLATHPDYRHADQIRKQIELVKKEMAGGKS